MVSESRTIFVLSFFFFFVFKHQNKFILTRIHPRNNYFCMSMSEVFCALFFSLSKQQTTSSNSSFKCKKYLKKFTCLNSSRLCTVHWTTKYYFDF